MMKTQRIEARLTPEQKDLFARAAAIEGQSLSDFLISSAHRAAQEVLKEYEIIRLSRQDQEVFVKALLDDSPPHPKLMKAAKEYKQKMGIQ